MKYTVVKTFVDLQDNNYHYRVGDTFPRAGKTVSDERLEELASGKNRLRQPLIEAVAEKAVKIEEPIEAVEPVEPIEAVEIPVEEAEEVVEKPKADKPKRRGRPPKAKTTEDE